MGGAEGRVPTVCLLCLCLQGLRDTLSALSHLPHCFFISFSLSRSTFNLFLSYQTATVRMGHGRSELAEIVGATCNSLHHLSSLPPVNSRAGTPPIPTCPPTTATVRSTWDTSGHWSGLLPGAGSSPLVMPVSWSCLCWSPRISLTLLPACTQLTAVVLTSLPQPDALSRTWLEGPGRPPGPRPLLWTTHSSPTPKGLLLFQSASHSPILLQHPYFFGELFSPDSTWFWRAGQVTQPLVTETWSKIALGPLTQ